MVAALGTHLQIAFEVGAIEHLVARRALRPQPLRHRFAHFDPALDFGRQYFLEPAHAYSPIVYFDAASTPRRNSATRCLTRLTHSPSGAVSISLMMRLPTTTASAMRATASAVAASRMPKPTPTGRLQCLRTMASF